MIWFPNLTHFESCRERENPLCSESVGSFTSLFFLKIMTERTTDKPTLGHDGSQEFSKKSKRMKERKTLRSNYDIYGVTVQDEGEVLDDLGEELGRQIIKKPRSTNHGVGRIGDTYTY